MRAGECPFCGNTIDVADTFRCQSFLDSLSGLQCSRRVGHDDEWHTHRYWNGSTTSWTDVPAPSKVQSARIASRLERMAQGAFG